jgi:hypothetical protein
VAEGILRDIGTVASGCPWLGGQRMTMEQTVVKFYQTGTFTVGNRLLAPDQRSVQANTSATTR